MRETPARLGAIMAGGLLGVTVGLAAGCKYEDAGRYDSASSHRHSTSDRMTRSYHDAPANEEYAWITEHSFRRTDEAAHSTFALDVDTASYSITRRFLNEGTLPPHDAVRIEEFVNYFDYDDAAPREADGALRVGVEIAACPWDPTHRLARVALRAREVDWKSAPPLNLVFVIDCSGSMNDAKKLPLLQRSLAGLTRSLRPQDRIAIVTYRNRAEVTLESTPLSERDAVIDAIDSLRAAGSTNGAGGLELGYEVARLHRRPADMTRVIFCTDGDFNEGITNRYELVQLIRDSANDGEIFLTVLGFGAGNYKDATLERLADCGDGSYAYIDSIHEADRALMASINGSMYTVARNARVQIEFNPAEVAGWRQIGYENRRLRDDAFRDNAQDAGEINAGHSIVALYEIAPVGSWFRGMGPDPLKYQSSDDPVAAVDEGVEGELFTLKLRYEEVGAGRWREHEVVAIDRGATLDEASPDFRWSAAVAAFGMVLRDSAHRGEADLDLVRALAQSSRGVDPRGDRAEFIRLVNATEFMLDESRVASRR